MKSKMSWFLSIIIVFSMFFLSCNCQISREEAKNIADAIFRLALVEHYAPIHYQDTDDSNYKADYITKWDYDGNVVLTDNWDNLYDFPLSAAVYYSIVESSTHWFIIYGFYHPRDWTDILFDQEHENDLEGCLVFIRKNGNKYGSLEGMITVFHHDFYSYKAPNSSLTDGHEDIDGVISFNYASPKTSQQAKGHGCKAFPKIDDFTGKDDQDGIIYKRGAVGEVPDSGNDRYVIYELVDIWGLWERQLAEVNLNRSNSVTFASWGILKGNKSGSCGSGTPTCAKDSAKAPWRWDDGNDGESYAGEMALDPIHLVDHYFNGLGDFSHTYIKNRYLEDLRDKGYSSANLPRGWPNQLNLDSMLSKLP